MSETADRRVSTGDRCIAWWLFSLAAMVFFMVVLGGLTRLTESGLSMVNWRPVTGWLPPLTDAGWRTVFEAYQTSPEYRLVNAGMSLAAFKNIFWLEYIHRLWGRLIGLVFLVPFVIFALKGWIDRYRARKLLVIFVLGGLQGLLGWYMVKSGLVDRPDVSQYRLVAHLLAALVIYSFLVWQGLSFYFDGGRRVATRYRRLLLLPTAMILITIMFGGFMAGLDAGYASQTFPLMDGRLIPHGLFAHQPAYLSLFEDVWTVHFVHRWLAVLTVLVIFGCWLVERRRMPDRTARLTLDVLAVLAGVQLVLGVTTVVSMVWLPVAVLHQSCAVLLWTVALIALFTSRTAGIGVELRVAGAGMHGRSARSAFSACPRGSGAPTS